MMNFTIIGKDANYYYFTKCNHQHRPQLSETEKEHIRGCHLSRRRLEEDDIPRVSRRFGAGWRDVGNSLHFTHAQLDQVTNGVLVGISLDCPNMICYC